LPLGMADAIALVRLRLTRHNKNQELAIRRQVAEPPALSAGRLGQHHAKFVSQKE
jgi:hypothetical protein